MTDFGQLVKRVWEKTTGLTSLLLAVITGCVEVSLNNMGEITRKEALIYEREGEAARSLIQF